MYLFLDTETTGLPRSWNAPVSDVDNWPRLVQLAWIRARPDGRPVERREQIVRPDGFEISAEAAEIHGITTERALAEGGALEPLLEEFADALDRSTTLVAHNVTFDRSVVGAELIRVGNPVDLEAKPHRCTMRESAEYCALPGGPSGIKWPTLEELHRHLFDEPIADAHAALADAEACRRSFFRLRELGVVD